MSQTYSKKYEMPYLNGFVALVILLVIGIGIGGWALSTDGAAAVLGVPYFYLFTRFRVVQPNVALVGTLFGKYAGILPHAGFYWLIPFYHTQTVSLKTGNYVTDTLKVNDSSGTPIEIAAAIVYHIENPAASRAGRGKRLPFPERAERRRITRAGDPSPICQRRQRGQPDGAFANHSGAVPANVAGARGSGGYFD